MANYERTVNRRGFLDGAKNIAVGAALGVSGAVIYNEADKITTGIETDNAIFYPAYEIHNKGLDAQEIRRDLDILFIEDWVSLNAPAISTSVFGVDEKGPQNLSKIASYGIDVMFGDVSPGDAMNKAAMVNTIRDGVGIGSLIMASNKQLDKTTRRAFLGLGLWSFSSFLTLPAYIPLIVTENRRFKQLLSRIGSIGYAVHPEEVIIHFRSAVMADKIMEAAKIYKQASGRKAKISFNVGAGHASMEDFLQLGQNFTRDFIMAHPEWVIGEMVETNGGSHQFSTGRIVGFDPGNPGSFVDRASITDRVLEARINEKLQKR